MDTEGTHGIEVGQRLEIDGKIYWISRILDDRNLELMPDPDFAKDPASAYRLPERRQQPEGSFWKTFWCIVLIIILFKMLI